MFSLSSSWKKVNMNQQAELEENNPQAFNQCNKVSDSGNTSFKEHGYSGDWQTKIVEYEFGLEGGDSGKNRSDTGGVSRVQS